MEQPTQPKQQELSWALKLVILVVGGATQMSFFISFFTVDYFNYFFGSLEPEFYLSLGVSTFSFIGAILALMKHFKTYQVPMTTFYVISGVLSLIVPIFALLYTELLLDQVLALFCVVVCLSLLGFFESLNSGCVFSFLGKFYGSKAVQVRIIQLL